jgi:predicted transposase YbfD/YdcC
LILESQNDYLIQVKGNQPTLFQDLQKVAQEQLPLTTHRTEEPQKGRTESREVLVFAASPAKQNEWAGLQTYIHVINSGIRDKKPYYEHHYYISSWKSTISAQIYGQKVRGHWAIENTNHYQKDVFLREDTNGIAHINAASCIAICNNFVVNITGIFHLKSIKECHNTLKNKIQKSIEYLRI